MTENVVITETNMPNVPLLSRGKVRDIYDLGEHLLLVATDRISAFDVIMPTPIPDKGRILTQLSVFWFKKFEDKVRNHLVSSSVEDYPEVCRQYRDQLEGRSILVRKAKPLPVECIVRGYLVGSGWKEYKASGTVCGIKLREGLVEAQKLDEPIFTPSTKAEKGEHDENISFDEMVKLVGKDIAGNVKELSLFVYKEGAREALERGIIIADTKFEFGICDDELLLIDEVLTPDSSRFWPADEYTPGKTPRSFDKQYLRDYLVEMGWSPDQPPPELPEEVVKNTRSKYMEAFTRLTGRNL
ncbi:MAG TPA: phosphoribosylaminoimidazolesuccinocarboxamide synthase [Deltaproteobacteria bacterium]|nr:phosphoribosylaminoimidazolesuccinocarboxamide synthase [Deltaproteobacteria bacterium]